MLLGKLSSQIVSWAHRWSRKPKKWARIEFRIILWSWGRRAGLSYSCRIFSPSLLCTGLSSCTFQNVPSPPWYLSISQPTTLGPWQHHAVVEPQSNGPCVYATSELHLNVFGSPQNTPRGPVWGRFLQPAAVDGTAQSSDCSP